MKRRNSVFKLLLSGPYLIWMSIFVLVPMGMVVYFALTDPDTGKFTLDNLAGIKEFLPVFGESVWLAAISALLCIVIAYPVAYVISKASPSRQRILILLVMLPMCMSFLLRTLAWVALLEDTGILNRLLGAVGIGPLKLIRTRSAVVLGMVYNYLPYMIMPLYSVLTKLDRRLIEAAEDLGCSGTQVFFKVILPLSAPGIISGTTMVFVPAVSTFYISKKLGSSGTALIGDLIESQFKQSYNPNLGAAMSLVLMVMIFICMGIMNRFAGQDEVKRI